MSFVIANIYIISILLCVLCVNGQNNTERISLCDKNSAYACLCDELLSSFIRVSCSYKSITSINEYMSFPEFTVIFDFSNNDITQIEYTSALDNPTVHTLLLYRNKINKIVKSAFQDLPNLDLLDLSENDLSHIDPGIFHGIAKLRYLYLHSNKFIAFDQYTFQNLPQLSTLVLSNNNLGNFLFTTPFDIFSLSGISVNAKIKTLYLDNTNMTNIPNGFFATAYNMRDLNLARNPIATFPQLPFTLESLDLSGTNISELLPHNFVNLPAIKQLRLNDLSGLKAINNYTFYSMRNLNYIELQNCKNLHFFSPYTFGENSANKSDIESFDFNVYGINFVGSGLRSLDIKLFSIFSRLTMLDLRANPWVCDNNIKWLLELNLEGYIKKDTRCDRPPNFHNRRLFSLKPEELGSEWKWKMTINGITRAALVLLCITLTALVLWLIILWPSRVQSLARDVGPGSPYSPITVEPNRPRL